MTLHLLRQTTDRFGKLQTQLRERAEAPQTLVALERAALADEGELSRLLLKVVATFVALALIWAATFSIDIRAKGAGKVVPVSQIQQIQNLEGGIVTEIGVHEGDIVTKGQPLVKLSPKQAEGELSEKTVTAEALTITIARLEAEIENREPDYPKAIADAHPELVRGEEQLRQERRNVQEKQMQVLNSQRGQKASELAELRARQPQVRANLKLLGEQIATIEPLVRQGAAAGMEVISLRREETGMRAQLSTVEHGIVTAQSALAEADQRIGEKNAVFLTEAREELTRKRTQLAALEGGINAKADQLSRTVVVAPMRGIVKTLAITTLGGVAAPGRTIVELVPLEDNLLVEARVSPSEIAWIRPGQPANVRITAFDYAVFGTLEGEVISVSPDSVTDERKDQTYYRIKVRTRSNSVEGPAGPLLITPGMIAEVDVLTGRRTILEYLIKPVLRGLRSSMSER